jgi:hypothetical protein
VTQKVHHQTERGARIALAKKQISRASYEAVLAGTLTLAEAKKLERDRGPHDTGQASSGRGAATETPGRSSAESLQDGTSACLCGCGESVKNRFRPGHDQRLFGELKRNLERDPLLRNERFTEEQRAYAKERGLI